MKNNLLISTLLLNLIVLACGPVSAEEETIPNHTEETITLATDSVDLSTLSGRQVFDEISNRHDQKYEFELKKMLLVDRSGNEEQRFLKRYVREIDDEETRYATVFIKPAGIKGVSLLTWQHDNSADDQWLYLPAYGKKMKRISKGGKKNYFMGTDYTFEDLASDSKDNFDYQRLPDETIDNNNYFVIKSVVIDPSLKKESGYGYRQFWIKQQNYFVTKIDFYDKRERLIKRQENSELVKIKDQVWRANKTTMEHFRNKHKTISFVESRSFDENDVPEKSFRERSIINGSLTK